ncbi:MAG: DNA mismatch repair protein MutS [Paludibacteraceae bacterium]|nr:DNA mismatch repair protein MutS [Paludibacteraceae bacterium]
MATNQETPMMKQFNDIKAKYPDALLLFRCGDFYETYCDDAVRASKELGITLTRRSSASGTSASTIAMAGFPFHALDTYLPKLMRAGLRVAICDQLEDPKLTKKLVKRGVTELVTPGVSYTDATVPGKENNFVACVHFGKDGKHDAVGVSFLDITTGEFLVAQGSPAYAEKLVSHFAPKEVLYMRGKKALFDEVFPSRLFTYELEDWMLSEDAAKDRLLKQFETASLKGFGVDKLPLGVTAAGGILHYLDLTQHLQTRHITHFSRIEEDKYMWLDRFSLRNLEIFPSADSPEAGSLLQVIDKTCSPMGGRLLRRWISLPLKAVKPIRQRQEVVEYFFRHPEVREQISDLLSGMGDLERLISKVSTGRITPREMVQLGYALRDTEPIRALCVAADDERLNQLGSKIALCTGMRERIEHTIRPDAPAQQSKPGVIRQGVDAELDELRDIQTNAKDYLLKLQERETQATGIPSLKVGYNNVFGYYLEVRNTYKDKVPQEWIRKQTLVSAERYITQELKEYEQKILGAEDRISIIETRLFNELILALCDFVSAIQLNAVILAEIDCLLSFAVTAEQNKYVCPEVNESLAITIHGGRHPVIERQLPMGEQYVANDIHLNNESQQIIIITGPNMAGKSALLRQTALIVLMAQMGSFVPAESAQIGVVDKIFTRVGASDNISLGESTFMVEMNEAAAILNNLSERSLVLFDELGRGTSTYDGISIAWAIVEYIHDCRFRPKTLFATHYHELNDLMKSFSRVRNYNVSVREVDKKVIFLRKLVPGGSEHSFGIHVAKMAGMPGKIIDRAEKILEQLESQRDKGTIGKPEIKPRKKSDDLQLSFIQLEDPVLEQIRDEFLHLDVNNLTPIEALNKLNDLKHIISGK